MNTNDLPDEQPRKRTCVKCGLEKSLETEFRFETRPNGNRYYHTVCRQCNNERVSANYDYRRERARQLRRAYGITIEEVEAMEAAQGGKCACCGGEPRPTPGRYRRTKERQDQFHVDHDHETGKVRALLCLDCNFAVGHMRNDPEYGLMLYRYLLKHCKK